MSYDCSTKYAQTQIAIDGMTAKIAVLDRFIDAQKANHAAWAAAWLAAVRLGPGNGVVEDAALAGIIGPLNAAVKDRSHLLESRTNAADYVAKAQTTGHDISR
jgi:hypothetical protein